MMRYFLVVTITTSCLLSAIVCQTEEDKRERLKRDVHLDNQQSQIKEFFNEMKQKNDFMHDVYIKTFESMVAKIEEQDQRDVDSSKLDYIERKIRALDLKFETLVEKIINTLETKIDEPRRIDEEIDTKMESIVKANDIILTTVRNFGDDMKNVTRKIQEVEDKNLDEAISNVAPCGESIVAVQGTIKFGCIQNYHNSRKCIWTVRAYRKPRIVFTLRGTLQQKINSSITILPYNNTFDPVSEREDTIKINFNDDTNHVVEHQLAFVTFHYQSEDRNVDFSKFTLNFLGEGDDRNETVKYSHYHYSEIYRVVRYPFSGGNYQTNEIATFAVNPVASSPFELTISKINLENQTLCTYDSITVVKENQVNSSPPSYNRWGPTSQNYRFCGLQGYVEKSTGIDSRSSYILIFSSDDSNEYDGFEFSWNVV